MKAILICGGRLSGKLAEREPTGVKCLLKFRGATLLEIAARAIAAAVPPLTEAVAVGGDDVAAEVDRIAPAIASLGLAFSHAHEGTTVVDNILIGLDKLEAPALFLVVSPDLPALSGAALSDFIARRPIDADIAVPVVTREAFLARFPGSPTRFEKFQEGYLTMGSALIFSTACFRKNVPLFIDAYNVRKSPTKMLVMLGFSFILAALTRRLSIPTVEAKASRITDCAVRGTLGCAAELAFDVDNEKEFEFIERLEGAA